MFKRFQSFRPPPLFLPRVAGEDERGGIERSVAVERLEPPEKWRHGMKTSGLRTPLTASAALYALVFLFATPVCCRPAHPRSESKLFRTPCARRSKIRSFTRSFS